MRITGTILGLPTVAVTSSLLTLALAIAQLAPAAALAQELPQATDIQLFDRPNDDGTALLLSFAMSGTTEETRVATEVLVEDAWLPTALRPQLLQSVDTQAGLPETFGWTPANPEHYVLVVDRYLILDESGVLEESVTFAAGDNYTVRLLVYERGARAAFDAGSATLEEEWFSWASMNNLALCVIFAVIILGFIAAARRNPKMFIRRISGIEAVDEAIGRATEMGKPVLHINGLDPLSQLSTIAAVNILGRIASKVAKYDTDLLVPCFDPVVMTVSQEVVKNAYIEAGRPDAYREDNIFFLTDQQFSYTASVCGIMVREKPAANFFLGYFYAESLLLAETGFTTGAIQIAGTDALSQLPFFITTCDYTLIGEELYAASAYLSREPMLLGSLRGQDLGKAFVMVMILAGSALATFGIVWLTRLFTPLT